MAASQSAETGGHSSLVIEKAIKRRFVREEVIACLPFLASRIDLGGKDIRFCSIPLAPLTHKQRQQP